MQHVRAHIRRETSRDAAAFAAAREPRVRAMGGDPGARVNRRWDRWFLDVLGGTDLEPVVALGITGMGIGTTFVVP